VSGARLAVSGARACFSDLPGLQFLHVQAHYAGTADWWDAGAPVGTSRLARRNPLSAGMDPEPQ
jgi:hypothetical protein